MLSVKPWSYSVIASWLNVDLSFRQNLSCIRLSVYFPPDDYYLRLLNEFDKIQRIFQLVSNTVDRGYRRKFIQFLRCFVCLFLFTRNSDYYLKYNLLILIVFQGSSIHFLGDFELSILSFFIWILHSYITEGCLSQSQLAIVTLGPKLLTADCGSPRKGRCVDVTFATVFKVRHTH